MRGLAEERSCGMLFDGRDMSKVLGMTGYLLSMAFILGIVMHGAPPPL
jgi:hypothetical protein